VFEFDGYEEKRNYILVVRKLEMHGNQKTTHGADWADWAALASGKN